MVSHSNGHISMDTILAVIPVLLIVAYTLHSISVTKTNYENSIEKQHSFDRLVSSADYLVNYGLAKEDDETYYPNWIMEIDDEIVKKVGTNSGLKSLSISLDTNTVQNTTCIYRLIVYGAEKQVKKLYFCGE